jgi:dCTP deaminase
MTIKSDKWIRRMAASHRMIEPFEPNQVKEAAGKRFVSHGTSSYGHDIRCSSEFKIFTNINSTIVDPKVFDETSFVDFKGEVCETSYRDRGGKYQGQKGVTLPRI